MRVGFGYDVHPLVTGRPLMLGGVEINYPLGLEGHSDADVLLHAICDGLLGAMADGDIGRHFPSTDEGYKDIRSTLLLRRVADRVREKGFALVNLDTTIVAERPRLVAYMPDMVRSIASILGVTTDRVSVKATTTEGLGFAGRGEGIAAYAMVLLQEAGPDPGFQKGF
jgi:2-C-methyl-D-erythritol 2,4-cyclodiphosphate synthase